MQSMTDMRQSISIGNEVLDPLAVELAPVDSAGEYGNT
jgi:hypothetical protein